MSSKLLNKRPGNYQAANRNFVLKPSSEEKVEENKAPFINLKELKTLEIPPFKGKTNNNETNVSKKELLQKPSLNQEDFAAELKNRLTIHSKKPPIDDNPFIVNYDDIDKPKLKKEEKSAVPKKEIKKKESEENEAEDSKNTAKKASSTSAHIKAKPIPQFKVKPIPPFKGKPTKNPQPKPKNEHVDKSGAMPARSSSRLAGTKSVKLVYGEMKVVEEDI